MGILSTLRVQPPDSFYSLLLGFHAFPLLAVPTLLFMDAPFGRFASKASKLNVNGNFGWFLMEIVAPVTLLTTLYRLERPPLTGPATVLAGLYVCHYIQRAILSPLVLSPKRSPQHISVPLSAMLWNFTNASLLAAQLAFFPPNLTLSSPKFWLGVLGWAVGFAGNVYHDEILNDLRRPKEKRLVLNLTPEEEREEKKDKEKSGGRYAIPRTAGFELVAFPNYTSEWFEWTCFLLTAGPLTVPVPALNTLHFGSTTVRLFSYLPFWPTRLLSPAVMFLLAELTAMLPRAMRAQEWYQKTFGDRYPKNRKIVFPWLF